MEDDLLCPGCHKKSSTKYNNIRHQKSCKVCVINTVENKLVRTLNFSEDNRTLHEDNKKLIEENRKLIEESIKIKIQNDYYKEEKIKLELEIKELIENSKKENENYKKEIKELVDKIDRLATKAIERPTTTTNNTVNNKIITLNIFPTQQEINQKIQTKFDDKYLGTGLKGVARFVYDHIIKLEDGSMVYACFDTSRQIFKYRDKDGNEIKDPKAKKLIAMIQPEMYKKSRLLHNYFLEECMEFEKKEKYGLEIDKRERDQMIRFEEMAFNVSGEIDNLENTNKFCN